MKLKQTTRKIIRDAFKNIGYKVNFKRSPFNDELTDLGFICPQTGQSTIGNNVFSREFYDKHQEAFKLLSEYKSGYFLTDTEQRICKIN